MSKIEVSNKMHVANEIEKYLDYHPNAADTLEGIIKWWISRIRLEETIEVVSEALSILESKGIVTKRDSADGRKIYCRSKQSGSREPIDKKTLS